MAIKIILTLIAISLGATVNAQEASINKNHQSLGAMFHGAQGGSTVKNAFALKPKTSATLTSLAPLPAPGLAVPPSPRPAATYVSGEDIWKGALVVIAGIGFIVLGASLGGLWWIAGGLGIFMLVGLAIGGLISAINRY